MFGDFLFIHYGFGGNDLSPRLTLHRANAAEFEHAAPRDQTVTLAFTTATRFCTGWHDLATGNSAPCPQQAPVQTTYSQCLGCQRKTGFNPAFYNASSVSKQQQARNATPHFLYLAHFGPGVIKVGISWSNRGIRRLLDQGARCCLILKEYPSADIARQYEAKIAALPGIAEMLQHKVKHSLLMRPYDAALGKQELLDTRQRLSAELGIQAEPREPLELTQHYLHTHTFTPHQLIPLKNGMISGRILGMIGSALIAEQNGMPYFLNLADFTGYPVRISNETHPNDHAPLQTSLF